jgi:hypothetical protein
MEKLATIDYVGNAILVPAGVAVILALVYGDTIYSWPSRRVILPLVIGFVGIVILVMSVLSTQSVEPSMPPHLFGNRPLLRPLCCHYWPTCLSNG